MSEWIVYSNDGIQERCRLKCLEYNGEWMGSCRLTATISSPVPIDFAIGDYVTYRGERFEINYDPTVIKSARRATAGDGFKYDNVVFHSLSDELTRCAFLDYVPSDNLIHYSSLPNFTFLADTVDKLAERIQVNLDRVYKGDRKWTVKVHPGCTGKTDVNVSVNSLTCWDALALAKSAFDVNFVIKNRTVTIGTEGIAVDRVFGYGKGNGLVTIERNADSDQQIITRLRAYGSTRNLPSDYYHDLSGGNVPDNFAVRNLMLPSFPIGTLDPYIDSANIDSLGVREGTVFFDGGNGLEEIYPSMEGMTASDLVSAGVETSATGALDELLDAEVITDNGVFTPSGGETSVSVPSFTVKLKDIGFDLNDHLTSESAMLSIKSGMCNGREFEIVKCEKQEDGSYLLTCNRSEDGSLGLYFPYSAYPLRGGDRFVLLNIGMPDVYVKAASQRLLTAARNYLAKNDYVRYSYTPKVDNIFLARQHDDAVKNGGASIHDTLKEGDLMLFEDGDLGIDGSVIIDRLTIHEGDECIPRYEITLRNDKAVGTIEKIQHQIDSIANGNGGGYNAQQLKSLIGTYGSTMFLRKDKDDRSKGKISSDAGFEVGEFIRSLYAGKGAGVDKDGNAEVESIRVRGYAEFMELIINRLSAIEGDQLLTEGDTIDRVVDLGDNCYGLYLRSKWEGYFTAQYPNNVLKGVINTLATGSGKYYTCWMRVNSVNTANNYIEVTLYPDEDTPAGRNFPPCEMMNIARWGNAADERRQSCLYLSSTEGRIVRLTGVTKPIIDASNYGSTIGELPEFLKGMDLPIVEGQDYLYARGIVVQDMIRMDYRGKPISTIADRGLWEEGGAYYSGDVNPVTGEYEISDVWYMGCKWRCAKTGTATAPAWNNTDWAMVEGNPEFTVGFEDTDTLFDPDRFELTLRIAAKLYNMDITEDILDADVQWTRYSEDAAGVERVASDNAWALKRANEGKSIRLTADDCDFNGYVPKVLRFIATVTLRDGTGEERGKAAAVFEY